MDSRNLPLPTVLTHCTVTGRCNTNASFGVWHKKYEGSRRVTMFEMFGARNLSVENSSNLHNSFLFETQYNRISLSVKNNSIMQ